MAKTIRIKRFQIGLNVLIQIVIAVFILGMVNYLAFNHYKRWDFSRDQKYSLSEQTKRILRNLKQPVKIIVFFSTGSVIYTDVQSLLAEYQYSSDRKLDLEYVDPYRNPARAAELQAKYKFGEQEDVLIVDYEGRSKFVTEEDMSVIDTSGEMFGQPPRLAEFKGEQALTSALIEVLEEKQKRIYFLQGQGQPEISAQGPMALLTTYLERQNVKSEPLNLMNVGGIPDDTAMLFLGGLRYDLSEREIEMLRQYWEKKEGRLFIVINPTMEAPKLRAFLQSIGITANDDRVLTTMTIAPGLTGVVKEPAAVFVEGTPITKRLKSVSLRFPGATSTLTLAPQQVQAENIRLEPLIKGAEGFWGERQYAVEGVYYDANQDTNPPVTIAAAAERGGLSDERVKVASSRMLVVGNAGFVTNEGLSEPGLDFALGGINWLIDREDFIGVAPKTRNSFNLNLTEAQVANLAILSMVLIPAIAAALGVAAWWSRRS